MRALAVTARATAWAVAAGSARMTTRAPVIVFAVSAGRDPDDQAARGSQGDEPLPVGVS
jgi:hypothetical protein